MQTELYSMLAVVGFTAVALQIDLKSSRIPNWLTVTAAVAGLVYHLVTGGGAGLVFSLGGFATGFGALLLLWLIGGGGGGDVKLMGAVGAWLGAYATLFIFVGSALFAVLCTVGVILWSRQRNGQVSRNKKLAGDNKESLLRQTIPYALPVAMSIWTLFAIHLLS